MEAVAARTGLTPEQLARNALHRRAIEAIIWGMPAVNTDLMYQAMAQQRRRLAGIVGPVT
jgi:hypothetical protein